MIFIFLLILPLMIYLSIRELMTKDEMLFKFPFMQTKTYRVLAYTYCILLFLGVLRLGVLPLIFPALLSSAASLACLIAMIAMPLYRHYIRKKMDKIEQLEMFENSQGWLGVFFLAVWLPLPVVEISAKEYAVSVAIYYYYLYFLLLGIMHLKLKLNPHLPAPAQIKKTAARAFVNTFGNITFYLAMCCFYITILTFVFDKL